MNYAALDAFTLKNGIQSLCDESMKNHTTFKTGGSADRFVTVESESGLKALVKLLKSEDIPYLIIGNGSNLLVSDRGLRGAVVSLGGEFKKATLSGGLLRCGAGASLSYLCSFARDSALSGLEFAWGIPGTVGGGVYMNAGAYGGEMKDVVRSVRELSAEDEIHTRPGSEMELAYRSSRYQSSEDIILSADFVLERASEIEISAKMEDFMNRRRAKQPYDQPSAGSTFKRPQGAFAAALVEQCGLKGESIGGAQVSKKHAGFIVNTGGASTADILELMKLIERKVKAETGVQLEPEIRLVGEGSEGILG